MLCMDGDMDALFLVRPIKEKAVAPIQPRRVMQGYCKARGPIAVGDDAIGDAVSDIPSFNLAMPHDSAASEVEYCVVQGDSHR